MIEQLHQLIDKVYNAPGIFQWRKSRFRRFFNTGGYGGLCSGVYDSYHEAASAAPKSLPLGYDNHGAALLYKERLSQVYPADYPMMFWLQKALKTKTERLCDLGGYVGISYYAYQPYISYPQKLDWQIVDLPHVIAVGRELASTRKDSKKLSFTDDFLKGDGSEILFTSGCLQYLEDSLAKMILTWKNRPKWVLVNQVPMHETDDFWTIQSIDAAFCPYHIQNKATFLADMKAIGYELLDTWDNIEKRCDLKFEQKYSNIRYYGAAFRLIE
jgi:putative methyltransferase (TIGR04325 family)